MTFPSINPTKTNAWKQLQKHYEDLKNTHMKDLFAQDKNRANNFTIKWEDFYLDYSKNRITEETLGHLLDLAEEVKLKEAMECQFSGEIINQTEGRAVLHTALRSNANSKVFVDGKNVIPEISSVPEIGLCIQIS